MSIIWDTADAFTEISFKIYGSRTAPHIMESTVSDTSSVPCQECVKTSLMLIQTMNESLQLVGDSKRNCVLWTIHIPYLYPWAVEISKIYRLLKIESALTQTPLISVLFEYLRLFETELEKIGYFSGVHPVSVHKITWGEHLVILSL
jgi:hypothetical protein